MNPFELSSCAAAWLGPKQEIPTARSLSTSPSESGSSGPITTKSISCARQDAKISSSASTATGRQVAAAAMPGLPGAQNKLFTERRL